jgi:chromosome segregation ATPase
MPMSIRKLIRDLRTAPPYLRRALCDELADQYQLTLALRFQQREEIEALEEKIRSLKALRLRHQKEIRSLKEKIRSLKAEIAGRP